MNNDGMHTVLSMPVMSGNSRTSSQSRGQTEEAVFTNPQSVPEVETQRCSGDVTAQTISTIIQRLKGLESQIDNIKNSVITSMELRIDGMKSSLINMIDGMASKTYSEAVQQGQTSINSSSIDEGYVNNTVNSTVMDTSQTLPKTVFTQNVTEDMEHRRGSPAQGIPVRVTNRDMIRERNKEAISQPTANISGISTSRSHNISSAKKTLIIGDSILSPINPRGMISGVQKHSKSGAKVQDIIDDITLYNMKSFRSVVLFVGGNDSSSGADTKLFEDNYDELVSLIKTSNPDCRLYICCISPRRDTNVKMYNACIRRIADHWANHGVTLINESKSFFCGKDGVPTARYYAHDGIHHSNSGTKHLLHTIDSHIHLIDDFDQCVYKPRRTSNGTGSAPGRFQRPSRQFQAGRGIPVGMNRGNGQNNNNNWYRNRRCFACGMTGHVIRDCLNK